MPPSWSSASRSSGQRYPPPSCAEEEPVSLASELDGLSKISGSPGVDGARVRGTVDQYPIIVNLGSPTDSVPGDSSMPGLDNVSSDDSSGPITPPSGVVEPAPRTDSVYTSTAPVLGRLAAPATDRSDPRHQQAVHCHDYHAGMTTAHATCPSSTVTNSRGRTPLQANLKPLGDSSKPQQTYSMGQSRRCSPVRAEAPARPPSDAPRGMTTECYRSSTDDPGYEQNCLSLPQTIGRSNSVRTGGSTAPSTRNSRRESPAGYSSDSNTTLGKERGLPAQSSASASRRTLDPSNPTLTDRFEEKRRTRQDQRVTDSFKTAPSQPAASNSRPPNLSHASRSPQRPPSSQPQGSQMNRRPRASTVTAAGPSAPMSRSTSMTRSASKCMSSDEAQLRSGRSQRASEVKFTEPQPTRASLHIPSQQVSTPHRSINTTGICITPCPRSIAVAGYTDWYTLRGLAHLDICPTCMSQIAHSRFRDFFIPSLPKSSTQKTRCAFALPWTRLAWAQMITKRHDSLEMLYQMTRPPPGTRACPGRIPTTQTWHRIVDPDTGSYLPRFHACSSCVRNIRVLMPTHRDTFHASPEPQERVCDFVTSSPRFVQYIDHLDDAATRAETDSSRRPNVREFLSYARRKINLRDCHRDKPSLGTWHYIPALPELSVCEDCYDEVVWPLAKAAHPIARMFSPSMRLLPGDAPNRCREASCQLYSGRMRARFRDAVVKGDYGALKAVVLRRFEAERRFRDRREELLVAEGKGYDCDEEMRKAVEEWKRWE